MGLNLISHLLVRYAPAFIRLPMKTLPFAARKKLTLLVLNRVFRDALADGDFEFLQDRCLKLSVTDIDFCCYLTVNEQQLDVLPIEGDFDVSFSAGLNDLLLIAARQEDPDSLFFQRRLKIEGDTELGLQVKNLIDSVDLDVLPRVLQLALKDLAHFIQQHRTAPESRGSTDIAAQGKPSA